MQSNETHLSGIFDQKPALPNRFPKVQAKADALELTLTQDQLARDAALQMDVLAAGSEQLVFVSAIRVEARDGAAGRALRPTFAVHLQADAAVGDAGLAGRVAGAAGEFARAVIVAAADALAEEVGVVAGTAL
jgi:hypothetical protein